MKHDWMKDYEDTELEPMELNPEERARVLADALQKIGQTAAREAVPAPVPKRRKVLRWVCALAAVLTITMLTAGAATGFLDAGEMLNWIFGARNTPEQLEGLDMIGYPIGLSQEQGGYTVTLHGFVGDRNVCYIVFDVTAPEGMVLNHEDGYGFQSASLKPAEYPGGFGYFVNELEDDDAADNAVRFMLAYDQEKPLKGNRYTLRLEGFVQYVEDYSGNGTWDNEQVLADAVWEFTFPMNTDFSGCIVSVPIPQNAVSKNGAARLRTAELSPLSIRLEYRESLWKTAPQEKPSGPTEGTEPEIRLHFADGSTLSLGHENCLTGAVTTRDHPSGYRSIQYIFNFHKPIHPADVDSVEIDGTRYELNG